MMSIAFPSCKSAKGEDGSRDLWKPKTADLSEAYEAL